MKKVVIMVLTIMLLSILGQPNFSTEVEAAEISDFWNSATSFYSEGKRNNNISTSLAGSLDPVILLIGDILKIIGNLIFFSTTICLGLKYMFSAADARASIKESFMTLIVAATFFYAAQTVTIFTTDAITEIVSPGVAGSMEKSAGKALKTVAVAAKALAFAATIVLGIRYMIASADVKADLKKSMFPFVIGVACVFATSSVLGFIANVMIDTLS